MSLIKETDYGTPKVASEKMVTLEIDGQEITVPEGTSIMRASMEAGIAIPKLCATDTLKAFGSCRVCLVEIEGRKGYPNLNDDDWLWGGDLQSIYHTIKVGIRSTHEDTRNSEMPAFGGILKREQINDVADHVLSLPSGKGNNEAGAALFKQN